MTEKPVVNRTDAVLSHIATEIHQANWGEEMHSQLTKVNDNLDRIVKAINQLTYIINKTKTGE